MEELAKKSSITNTSTPFNDEEDDGDLGLSNPYSRISCFVLYLYTLEYGEPSLAQDLSRVARTKDDTMIRSLGPYAQALRKITSEAEAHRDADDKIESGTIIQQKLNGVDWNIAGAFFLWKGTFLSEDTIRSYEKNLYTGKIKDGVYDGKSIKGNPLFVNLPGNVGFSHELKDALTTIKNASGQVDLAELKPVLFVIICQNYMSSQGVRLNNEAFTAYPGDQEMVLRQGCRVYVLQVQKKVVYKNNYTTFQEFNDQEFTIVHLFAPI